MSRAGPAKDNRKRSERRSRKFRKRGFLLRRANVAFTPHTMSIRSGLQGVENTKVRYSVFSFLLKSSKAGCLRSRSLEKIVIIYVYG